MNERILSQIKQIDDQISVLSERAYNPQLTDSEQKEIAKRKKKLKRFSGCRGSIFLRELRNHYSEATSCSQASPVADRTESWKFHRTVEFPNDCKLQNVLISHFRAPN